MINAFNGYVYGQDLVKEKKECKECTQVNVLPNPN